MGMYRPTEIELSESTQKYADKMIDDNIVRPTAMWVYCKALQYLCADGHAMNPEKYHAFVNKCTHAIDKILPESLEFIVDLTNSFFHNPGEYALAALIATPFLCAAEREMPKSWKELKESINKK